MSLFGGRAAILRRRDRIARQIKFLADLLVQPFAKPFGKAFLPAKTNTGYLYLLLTFLSAGLTTVTSRYLLSGRLNAFHVLTYTSFIGLTVLALFKHKTILNEYRQAGSSLWRQAVVSFIGYSVHGLCFNIALEYLSTTQTVIIYYTYPALLYFAGLIFLGKTHRQAVNAKVLLGIALSFTGICLAVTGGKNFSLTLNAGVLYIWAAAAAVTVFTIMNKKKKVPEIAFLFTGQAAALLTGSIFLSANREWMLPNLEELAGLAFIAVIYNILNLLFYLRALQRLSIEKLSTLMYISPVITSALAVVILKEPVPAAILAGFALVLSGNLIAGKRHSK